MQVTCSAAELHPGLKLKDLDWISFICPSVHPFIHLSCKSHGFTANPTLGSWKLGVPQGQVSWRQELSSGL